ncbi:hypothetical protein KDJ61_gp33 [Gordonia phage TZGordon]|uniref:Uncharacterized protein n=1 Tax=Gordonia phage TZGordon TaxID=2744004 RepID=A0A6N0A5F0_9CAUD|nr:hypothetical protein KDJ61_gp33 [Gordonia phage TZGordon]QKO03001.1 hypothetical protein SEA_TZGORDON_83 [Gordonia phage TZGordon]
MNACCEYSWSGDGAGQWVCDGCGQTRPMDEQDRRAFGVGGTVAVGAGSGVAEVLDTWSCGHCTWTVQAEGQSATVLSARWHLYRAHHVETNGADVADHGQHGTRERFTPKPKRNRRGKSKAEETTR